MSQTRSNQIKILHLPKWYPDKFNPTFGLLLKAYMLQLSKLQAVIYVCPDPKAEEKYRNEISTQKNA